MKRIAFSLFTLLLILFSISCEDTGYPTPILDSISPSAKVRNMPSFTLTVKGENFIRGSEIVFNGIIKNTRFISSVELSSEITPEDFGSEPISLARNLSGETSIPVYVTTPFPGGGNSDTLYFTFKESFTFKEPFKISDLKKTAEKPKIYCDKTGTIHIMWQVKEESTTWLAYTYSKSGGDNFSSISSLKELSIDANTVLRHAATVGESENLFLFLSYYVVSSDSTEYNIWGIPSADGGLTFGTSFEPVSTTDKVESFAIGTYGAGNIFLAWLNTNSENIGTILSVRSTNLGTNFTAPQQINMSNAFSGMDMAVDESGKITIAWCAFDPLTGKDAIFYSESTDYSLSFSAQNLLISADSNGDNLRKPVLAYNSGVYCHAWWENKINEPNKFTIKTARKSAGSADVQYGTVASFEGLDIDNLPDLQLSIDKIGNIYIALALTDNKVYIYRSIDGGSSFQEIALIQDWGATAPASITLDMNGSIIAAFPKEVEYETEENGETVINKAYELFFIKSNE